jgi:hypothetical protein
MHFLGRVLLGETLEQEVAEVGVVLAAVFDVPLVVFPEELVRTLGSFEVAVRHIFEEALLIGNVLFFPGEHRGGDGYLLGIF